MEFMSNLAEQIANDLMAQNMLDVPCVVAAKVIASTIEHAQAEPDAKCIQCQTPIEDGDVCDVCLATTLRVKPRL